MNIDKIKLQSFLDKHGMQKTCRKFQISKRQLIDFTSKNNIVIYVNTQEVHGECLACKTENKKDGKRFCNTCIARIRRLGNKIRGVRYKGSVCGECGLEANNENLACFDFHHLYDKDFSISGSLNRKWEFIKAELDKCQLLCACCHRLKHSLENNDKMVLYALSYLDESKDGVFYTPKTVYVPNKCDQCERPIAKEHKTCRQCCTKVQDRPSKKLLKEMVDSMTWVAIGRKYGVSDNAVRKWAKKYQII
jgi:hypothetical protein